MGDGLAILILIAALQDNYLPSIWIQTNNVLSKCKSFILTLLKPFTLTYAFLFFFFWSTDRNYIKGDVDLKSKKNNSICKPFDVKKLKKIGRQYKATLNDVVLALTSISLK